MLMGSAVSAYAQEAPNRTATLDYSRLSTLKIPSKQAVVDGGYVSVMNSTMHSDICITNVYGFFPLFLQADVCGGDIFAWNDTYWEVSTISVSISGNMRGGEKLHLLQDGVLVEAKNVTAAGSYTFSHQPVFGSNYEFWLGYY